MASLLCLSCPNFLGFRRGSWGKFFLSGQSPPRAQETALILSLCALNCMWLSYNRHSLSLVLSKVKCLNLKVYAAQFRSSELQYCSLLALGVSPELYRFPKKTACLWAPDLWLPLPVIRINLGKNCSIALDTRTASCISGSHDAAARRCLHNSFLSGRVCWTIAVFFGLHSRAK